MENVNDSNNVTEDEKEVKEHGKERNVSDDVHSVMSAMMKLLNVCL